jgi:hypothetical protein
VLGSIPTHVVDTLLSVPCMVPSTFVAAYSNCGHTVQSSVVSDRKIFLRQNVIRKRFQHVLLLTATSFDYIDEMYASLSGFEKRS